MEQPTVSDVTRARIQAARDETQRAITGDSVLLIHPFDMCILLNNPMVTDVVIVNMAGLQYVVIDGAVYRQSSEVKNQTKLDEIMNLKGKRDDDAQDGEVSNRGNVS